MQWHGCPAVLQWRGCSTVLLWRIGRWRLSPVPCRLAVAVLRGGSRGPSALMGRQVHAGRRRRGAIRLGRPCAIRGWRWPVPSRRWSVGLSQVRVKARRLLGGPAACILWVSVLRRRGLRLLRRRLGVVRRHRGALTIPRSARCRGRRSAPGGAPGGAHDAWGGGRLPSGIKLLLLLPAASPAAPPCTSASSASSSPTAGSESLAAATATIQAQHGRHLGGRSVGLESR